MQTVRLLRIDNRKTPPSKKVISMQSQIWKTIVDGAMVLPVGVSLELAPESDSKGVDLIAIKKAEEQELQKVKKAEAVKAALMVAEELEAQKVEEAKKVEEDAEVEDVKEETKTAEAPEEKMLRELKEKAAAEKAAKAKRKADKIAGIK